MSTIDGGAANRYDMACYPQVHGWRPGASRCCCGASTTTPDIPTSPTLVPVDPPQSLRDQLVADMKAGYSMPGDGLLANLAQAALDAGWRAPPDRILGTGPDVTCRVFAPDVAVHWWPADAGPGTPCLCGAATRTQEGPAQ